ncbi:MAG: flavodoxin-dependent (E)-4-hydroxy-3-methylbut-2-enyl-diphosphate synthase [Filifactoraceae bacterium]
MIERRKTKAVSLGNVIIGNNNPITVQSMTNTDTRNIELTVRQIKALEKAGCNIVRSTVADIESAEALKTIIPQINIPLVADIHFDHRLALAAIKSGVQGLRINPGNIGNKHKVREVVEAAKANNIKIRVGVNGGSLDKKLIHEYGHTARAMVESAFEHIKILEEMNFYNTVISLKASDIFKTIEAYQEFSKVSDYPLHLGITESGTMIKGTIKSSIGIGHLLLNGIGDTIRVSLTSDPVEEVMVGRELLRSLELDKSGIRIISCPTCGRTKINLIALADRIEKAIGHIDKSLSIAIMGCAVNGPGEAKGADIGIAGGNKEALLFKKGEIIRKIPEAEIEKVLLEEISKF